MWSIAYPVARTAPIPAHSAATSPITSAVVLPVSEPDFSSEPTIGNCPSAESTISCCKCGLPWKTKPRIVVSTSSRGKMEKKP